MVRPVLRWRAGGYVVTWGAMVLYLVVADATTQFVWVMVLIGFVTSFTTVASTARAALIGLEQMRFPAIADVVSKLISVTAVIVVLLLGGGVVAVSVVAAVAAAINMIIMWRALRRFPQTDRELRVPIRGVIVGAAAFLVADAALIVYQQVDTVVMSLLVDRRQVGWYAAADQLFASLLFVPTILMMALFPVIGRLNDEDPERLKGVISRVITSLLLVSVPVGLGTIAVGSPVAELLFGPKFKGAGPVLSILGIVIIITSETILIGRYAIATGHRAFWNALMIAGIVLTIPLDLVLVPWANDRYDNGAIGGALAYIVTESMMFVIGTWRFARTALTRDAAVRAIKILACGAAMLAAVWPLRDVMLAVPIGVGAVVYAVGVMITGSLGPEERVIAERFVKVVRRSA